MASYNKPLTLKGTKFSLICRRPFSNLRIMANYLLLRNNKESGPYSADDLVKLGLKAYDLLWIQGKSAAWRYPSEIDELKSFAPQVEEQPFDRFFKKNETTSEPQKVETPAPVMPAVTQVIYEAPIVEVKYQQPIAEAKYQEPVVEQKYQEPVVEQKYQEPVVEPQYERYIPKKSVAVTMPGQRNPIGQQPSMPVQQPVQTTRQEVPVTEPPKPTITVSENPAAAQIKYSQPLDEIKEMYVKTLQDRKQKIARRGFWLQSLKQASVILGLVAIGVVAGFIIKSNKTKHTAANTQLEKQSQPATVQTTPIMDSDDTNTNSKSEETATRRDNQPLHQPNGGYVNKLSEIKDKPIEPKQEQIFKSPNNTKKEVAAANTETKSNTTTYVPQNSETNPSTGERSRKVRDDNSEVVANSTTTTSLSSVERKSSPNAELASLVSVKSNNYKKVAFGGIRDLQLTVVNDSKYILDNVTVELQYIKPNELPLKTESIEFNSVAPNATSTIRVPDTNRGIRVVFRITRIKKRAADERVADN